MQDRMQVKKRFLYAGAFLVAIGAVLVATDLNGIDETAIEASLRYWPLAVIALGVGIAVRRTRFNVAGGLVAAALPGLVLGGAIAVAPQIAIDCGTSDAPSSFVNRSGTFDGPARVDVATGCGSVVVTTTPGSAWSFDAGDAGDRTAQVDATGNSLSIDGGRHRGWRGFDAPRDAWHLTLPTSRIENLAMVVNTGEGDIDLAGADIGRLDLTTNAGRTTVDLSGTSVRALTGEINAGMLSLTLPSASDLTGSLEANAGGLEVCVPSGVGLLVHTSSTLGSISWKGHEQDDGDWRSPDYASAAHRTELTVNVNLGAMDIDPIGGCK
jgi:hypothetical protein